MTVWWGIFGALMIEAGLGCFVVLTIYGDDWRIAIPAMFGFGFNIAIGGSLIIISVASANQNARLCGSAIGPRKMIKGDI